MLTVRAVRLTLRLRAIAQRVQFPDLARRQGAYLSWRQSVEREGAHPDAGEVAHLVAEAGQHPAHLPVAALADRDLQDALVARPLHDLDATAAGPEPLAAARVGEPHAVLKLLCHFGSDVPVDDGAVCFRDAVARVSEPIRQLP